VVFRGCTPSSEVRKKTTLCSTACSIAEAFQLLAKLTHLYPNHLISFCFIISITFIFPSSVYYRHLLVKSPLCIYLMQILFYKLFLWRYLNCCSRFSATSCCLSFSLFSLSNFACSLILSFFPSTVSSSASISAKYLLSSASRSSRSL